MAKIKGPPKKGFFPITSVCRDDIPEAFWKASDAKRAKIQGVAGKLTDEEMRQLAEKICEYMFESDVYWLAIRNWINEKFPEVK